MRDSVESPGCGWEALEPRRLNRLISCSINTSWTPLTPQTRMDGQEASRRKNTWVESRWETIRRLKAAAAQMEQSDQAEFPSAICWGRRVLYPGLHQHGSSLTLHEDMKESQWTLITVVKCHSVNNDILMQLWIKNVIIYRMKTTKCHHLLMTSSPRYSNILRPLQMRGKADCQISDKKKSEI